MNDKRYRVAQWATGHTGTRSLKAIIEHPQFDLVGVHVYSDAKVGRDAGELSGTDPTGVLATSEIEDILVARPDCVVYTPMAGGSNTDHLCKLLESGANIVTLLEDFHHPASLDPDVRQRIEAACERGGTSLYATGPSPGFITEIFPLAVTTLQRRLDCLTIEEFADMATRNSPEMIARMFGGDPAATDLSQAAAHLGAAFGASFRQLAEGLNVPLDEVVSAGSVATAAETAEIGVTRIEKGTVGAWRIEVTGLRHGRPLMVFRANWYVTKDLEPAWELGDTGWHVVVEGDAPLDINIRFPSENYAEVSPGYVAHILVNAVPSVCEAPPGIRTTIEMPRIIANLG